MGIIEWLRLTNVLEKHIQRH
ncbi:tonB-dependent Receptor Plug domain protein, partial [Yersinia pestis PY-71]